MFWGLAYMNFVVHGVSSPSFLRDSRSLNAAELLRRVGGQLNECADFFLNGFYVGDQTNELSAFFSGFSMVFFEDIEGVFQGIL